MPIRWRWDQGRLDYFNFDNLCTIAAVLVDLEGVNLRQGDPLRHRLTTETGLPFFPQHYRVWRNYARIFKWTLLASRIDGRLMVTDLCRKIGDDSDSGWGVDEYFSTLIPRLYFPHPATQAYAHDQQQLIYPLCAILRYLLAQFKQRGEASINLDELFDLIIGNQMTGSEQLLAYLQLPSSGYQPTGDERRQVREMLIFGSQSSFLKWQAGTLFLDVMQGDGQTIAQLEQISVPMISDRHLNKDAEIIQLGTLDDAIVQPLASVAREQQDDLVFTEGRRVRVTHLRVERSPRLRRMYFRHLTPPFHCDMCQASMNRRYPWTDNLLEVHHLLPLASVIRVTREGTSFADLVPLCPNCHKSTHAYYRIWLRERQRVDFSSVQEARYVYNEAKEQMVL